MQAGILIFCCGNPSRGDDAIGSLFFERLEKIRGGFDVFCDYQLQIEHVFDMNERDCVIFIDASVDIVGPFEMREIFPRKEICHSTHILSPEALLEVYVRILKKPHPKAYLLGVKGQSFDLGEPLSRDAERNLELAWDFLKQFLGLKCSFGKAAFPG